MGMLGDDYGTVGCQPMGIGDVFQDGGTGGAAIRVGYVVADPLHRMVTGKLPTWGCKADNGKIAKEKVGGGLGITTTVESNGGGRI